MPVVHLVAGTAILIGVPLLWGLLMGFGTDIIKGLLSGNRKDSHE